MSGEKALWDRRFFLWLLEKKGFSTASAVVSVS